jgi:hypothetical protein
MRRDLLEKSNAAICFLTTTLALVLHLTNGAPLSRHRHGRGLLEMAIRGSGPVTFANQRRSQRILLAVPLLVSGRHADGTVFVEHAFTLIVNASGGSSL